MQVRQGTGGNFFIFPKISPCAKVLHSIPVKVDSYPQRTQETQKNGHFSPRVRFRVNLCQKQILLLPYSTKNC